MGYVTNEQVNWAPHMNNPINTDRCHELNYDQSAIDLLQLIPWLTIGTIYPDSIVVDYACDGEVEASRDPLNYMIDDPENPQVIDPWMLPLTYGMLYGQTLLIDAREGTLRLLNGPKYDIDDYPVPENDDHYLNWPPQPAAPWIDSLIQDFYTLKMIPINYNIICPFEPVILAQNTYHRRKNSMTMYGWPDHFRLDDWRRDLDDLEEQWIKEDYEDMDLASAGTTIQPIREL